MRYADSSFHLVRLALLTLFVLCCSKPSTAGAESPEVVRVRSTGSAETRDGALVDACRLAVAQIHGGRVVGALLKTNEKDRKALVVSGGSSLVVEPGSPFVETRDSTALSFDGLLVRYSLVSQDSPGIGRNLWKVVIDADVLKALPDRFEGRIMVVTPTEAKLLEKVGEKSIAGELARAVQSWFANTKQFALLERTDESILDDELARAADGSTAVAEKSKLSSGKAADIVINIEGGELEFSNKSTSFKTTSRQSHTCEVHSSLIFKIIDVATKGEIGRATVALVAKKSSTDPEQSRAEAIQELVGSIRGIVPTAGLQIMSYLDSARIIIGTDGEVTVTSPHKGISLKGINAIRLSKPITNSDPAELGIFELSADGSRLAPGWQDRGITEGQILSFMPILE